MPVSPYSPISQIVELMVLLKPKSILDVGAGFGKYGMLAREYLDVWQNQESDRPYEWKTRIDAIEIFPDYITPAHGFFYDNVYVGDARDSFPKETSYDLVLLIDVFEHFTYEDGMELLKKMRNVAKHVIISTPRDIGHQGSIYHNEHETHRCQWEEKHFPDAAVLYDMVSLIVYEGPAVERVKKLQWRKDKETLKSLIKRYLLLRTH